MFLILFCFVFSLILLKYSRIHSLFVSYKLAKIIQGPPLLPLIGSIQFVGLEAVEVHALHEKYSKLYAHGFRIWAFGKLIYVSYAANDVEAIITNPRNSRKSFTYEFLESFLGDGLLLSYANKWFQRRKILTPAFHLNLIRKFIPSIKQQSKMLIDSLRKQEKNNRNGTNLQQVISRLTLNIICETAMGVTVSECNALDKYRKQIHRYGELVVKRSITPWVHPNVLYKLFGEWKDEKKITKKIHNFTTNIIASRIRTAPNNDFNIEENWSGKQCHAMLDTLLMAKKNGLIDAAGIQEEVDTFIFEGYDTTMTAITFTLLMLAHHSDVQQRLFEEIIDVYDDQRTDVTQYNEMKYLDCVIKETIRLYPPVPFIGRVLGEETIVNGIKLPIGTNVHILISRLHRDPRYFENPDKFIPERFTKKMQTFHPFAYIPFSASHRNCIGQKFALLEMKIVIADILTNFHLEPVTSVEEIVFKSDLVLRTKEPVRIRFVSR